MTIRAAAVLVASLYAGAAAQAQAPVADGGVLFIRKGCLGCHGASARGGVGPSLARTTRPGAPRWSACA